MTRMFCLLLLVGMLASSGCEQKSVDRLPDDVTSEDVRRDAGQAVNTASEFARQSNEEFQKDLEVRIEKMDVEIAKLREKGSGLKEEAKANWDRKMAELETKREAARVKLAEIGDSSAEAWTDVQQGAQSAWDELDKAFNNAARELGSSAKPE
ncbi:MAG TPA: hypothetical protein VMM76_14240 [Pirellulaceae bacterium]|nr:hypothetical protein [Pirellulaceae bacterium]